MNDLLLSLAFTSGGSVADFFVWRWVANPAGGFAYTDCTASLPQGRVFAALNTTTVPVPYRAFGQTSYAPNAFAEAAIDLTTLLGNFDPCMSIGIKTIMVKTKASQSGSASIEDFADPIQHSLRIGPAAVAGADQSRCLEGPITTFPLQGTASPGIYPISSTLWSVVAGEATIDDPAALTTAAHVSSSSATLRLTAVEANGCAVSSDSVLTVRPATVCEITGPSVACPRSTTVFLGPTPRDSYAWSVTGDATISGPADRQSVTIVAGTTCGGTFTVSLTTSANNSSGHVQHGGADV